MLSDGSGRTRPADWTALIYAALESGINCFEVAGLEPAIMDGLAQADITGPVAVVPADLPSLTPAELTEALTTAAGHPAGVVADRAGTGTTLLTARAPVHLRPRYGEGSFRRHVAAGAVPLPIPAGSGLRRDVDLAADLPTVTGSATRTLLDEFGRVPVRFTR